MTAWDRFCPRKSTCMSKIDVLTWLMTSASCPITITIFAEFSSLVIPFPHSSTNSETQRTPKNWFSSPHALTKIIKLFDSLQPHKQLCFKSGCPILWNAIPVPSALFEFQNTSMTVERPVCLSAEFSVPVMNPVSLCQDPLTTVTNTSDELCPTGTSIAHSSNETFLFLTLLFLILHGLRQFRTRNFISRPLRKFPNATTCLFWPVCSLLTSLTMISRQPTGLYATLLAHLSPIFLHLPPLESNFGFFFASRRLLLFLITLLFSSVTSTTPSSPFISLAWWSTISFFVNFLDDLTIFFVKGGGFSRIFCMYIDINVPFCTIFLATFLCHVPIDQM